MSGVNRTGIIFFIQLEDENKIGDLIYEKDSKGKYLENDNKDFINKIEEITNDSRVLHVPSLCVFELSTILIASFISANSSTYI